jgi:hypothetical protein
VVRHSGTFADHLKESTYRKNTDGTLTARMQGENNGKAFAQDWPLTSGGPQEEIVAA